MGHRVGKDVYRQLGQKLDGLQLRMPWSPTLQALLEDLYSKDEAELVVRMPFTPATLDQIVRVTGMEPARAQRTLEALASKGLVFDMFGDRERETQYVISPMVVGIFEFTMMRAAPDADHQRRAKLFHEYLGSDGFFEANLKGGEQFFMARALPHEPMVLPETYAEVLDYERASAIVDGTDSWSVGICSCRHEKHHLGQKPCDVPLESCTSFGDAARYLVRHDLARAASREEMHDLLARSRDLGLMLSADNVQRNVSFICHCCTCCCHLIGAINDHGCTGTIVSSNYLAEARDAGCEGCGKCVKACPVDAIALSDAPPGGRKRQRRPVIDEELCLGCGVCGLQCPTNAMHLAPREQRVFHPANTFERVILQSLERGTLQNLVFDNPQSSSQGFMRALLGGILRLPPVKRALVGDALRSRFLAWLNATASREGQTDVTEF